ncbi:hypothetical protein GOBAR_DD36730 [Gossypium barbadense]|nr:hypothetical protein GOBAR_DD36730 [Gossypium barbadense]
MAMRSPLTHIISGMDFFRKHIYYGGTSILYFKNTTGEILPPTFGRDGRNYGPDHSPCSNRVTDLFESSTTQEWIASWVGDLKFDGYEYDRHFKYRKFIITLWQIWIQSKSVCFSSNTANPLQTVHAISGYCKYLCSVYQTEETNANTRVNQESFLSPNQSLLPSNTPVSHLLALPLPQTETGQANDQPQYHQTKNFSRFQIAMQVVPTPSFTASTGIRYRSSNFHDNNSAIEQITQKIES